MSELTIRAKTIIKTTNESINIDWSYQKGTPVERVANDITGGRYEQLQATNQQLVEAAENARLFILNGVENGYVRLPDADVADPAHDTLPMLEKAITNAKQQKND